MSGINLLTYYYSACPKPITSFSRKALACFLNKKSFLLTRFDLLWAMTYGNRNIRFFLNKGPQAISEYLNWRSALTDFLFDFGGSDLAYNENVSCLETSYVAELMFESGMALTTLLAKDVLGIPHLNHFGKICKCTGSSHKRPDFVAFYGGFTYFFEAKGTLYSRSIHAENTGFQQLNSCGAKPWPASPVKKYLCEAYTFSKRRIVCDLIDPPDDDGDGFLEKEVEDDYQPLRISLTDRLVVEGKIYAGVFFSDGFFGLLNDLNRSFFFPSESIIEEKEIDNDQYTGKIFSDGTLILRLKRQGGRSFLEMTNEIKMKNYNKFEADLVNAIFAAFNDGGIEYTASDRALDDVLYQYLSLMGKLIGPRPRKVHISKELLAKISGSDSESKRLDELVRDMERKFTDGSDVNGHLSKTILKAEYNDMLLNDWKIKHLHLDKNDSSFFDKNRPMSGDLLFVVVDHDDVYFLDVEPHGTPNVFCLFKYLQIIQNNWEKELLVQIREIQSISFAVQSDADIKAMRDLRVNIFIYNINGKFYSCKFSSGYTMAGQDTSLFREVGRLIKIYQNMDIIYSHLKFRPFVINDMGSIIDVMGEKYCLI